MDYSFIYFSYHSCICVFFWYTINSYAYSSIEHETIKRHAVLGDVFVHNEDAFTQKIFCNKMKTVCKQIKVKIKFMGKLLQNVEDEGHRRGFDE